jgi:hypothetical protein
MASVGDGSEPCSGSLCTLKIVCDSLMTKMSRERKKKQSLGWLLGWIVDLLAAGWAAIDMQNTRQRGASDSAMIAGSWMPW